MGCAPDHVSNTRLRRRGDGQPVLRGRKQSPPAEGHTAGTLSGGGVLVIYCCRAIYPKPSHLTPQTFVTSLPNLLGQESRCSLVESTGSGSVTGCGQGWTAEGIPPALDRWQDSFPGGSLIRGCSHVLVPRAFPVGSGFAKASNMQCQGEKMGQSRSRDTQSSSERAVWEETGAGAVSSCADSPSAEKAGGVHSPGRMSETDGGPRAKDHDYRECGSERRMFIIHPTLNCIVELEHY